MRPSEYIGRKISRIREEKGIPQHDLSLMLGVNYSTVKLWESQGYNGSLAKLAEIHIIFSLPLWSLLPTEEDLE